VGWNFGLVFAAKVSVAYVVLRSDRSPSLEVVNDRCPPYPDIMSSTFFIAVSFAIERLPVLVWFGQAGKKFLLVLLGKQISISGGSSRLFCGSDAY